MFEKGKKMRLLVAMLLTLGITTFAASAALAYNVGDATEETALLRITGEVEYPGYFSMEGLKSYTNLVREDVTFGRMSHHGPSSFEYLTVTGIFLEDLLKEVMQLTPEAYSITISPSDNYQPGTYALDESSRRGVYMENYEGNKMMLYFDISGDLRLAVCQVDENDVTTGEWLKYVVSIVVNAAPDKGALADFVADAENFIEEWYTAESWARFATALANAKNALETALLQGPVDTAYGALATAERNLRLVLYSATPEAFVTKLNGNQNDLTITVVELYADGSEILITETFIINNNSVDIYDIGGYMVYVDTKGNDQIRDCRIVE